MLAKGRLRPSSLIVRNGPSQTSSRNPLPVCASLKADRASVTAVARIPKLQPQQNQLKGAWGSGALLGGGEFDLRKSRSTTLSPANDSWILISYRSPSWPGLLVPGRLPVHIWPRKLMWAFEWHDTQQDLILTRGEPWFYVFFEGNGPARTIRLVEAAETDALTKYCQGIDGVVGFINRSYSLFSVAKQRRPDRLLVPRGR
jgi:hypothetical protein